MLMLPFFVIAITVIILIVIWVQYMDNYPKSFDEDFCRYNHYKIYQVQEIDRVYYVAEVLKYKLLGIFPVYQMIYDMVDRPSGCKVIKRFSDMDVAEKWCNNFYARYLATKPDKVMTKKTLVSKK